MSTESQLYDKIRGCYYGAAIADAMGGPVETMHHQKIRRLFGRVEALLPYTSPPGHIKPGPNTYYVSQDKPGTYTDDTRGRNLLVGAMLEKGGRVTADDFSAYLLKYMNPEAWWPAIMASYWNIKFEGMAPRDAGRDNMPGGAVGWWSPLGIINAGNPETAYWDAVDVCSIVKRGIDRELASAVPAAVAEAFRPNASIESVVSAATRYVGPEARQLILNAVAVARNSHSVEEFYLRAYDELLVPWPARFQNKQNTKLHLEGTISCDLREQVPIAIACFVLANGDARESIINAVNYGRDADTIATTTGAIAGAFQGTKNLPREWMETCRKANPDRSLEVSDLDLDGFCDGLYKVLKAEMAQTRERTTSLLAA